jgi:hypothetical protein
MNSKASAPRNRARAALIFAIQTLLLTHFLMLPAVAQVVDNPDPGLRAAIRQALNKPTGDITVADNPERLAQDWRQFARLEHLIAEAKQ